MLANDYREIIIFDGWGELKEADNLKKISDNFYLLKGNPKNSYIVLDYPQAWEKIKSPLAIKGRAKGTWFFEASFPVELVDSSGNIIAQTAAQAQSDWMTEDFVPFIATLDFSEPEAGEGKLILKKDNPSGLAEYDDALEITVYFK